MLTIQLTYFLITIIAFCLLASVVFAVLLIRKMRKQLHTDPISGLPSYQAFTKHISNRQQKAASIFLIDLNNFRRFNKMGYNTGDFVLRLFSERLKSNLGAIAQCYRYRLGDEFLIITTLLKADMVEANIQMLNHKPIGVNSESIAIDEQLSFAYGKAQFSGQLVEAIEAIKAAHAILREQKGI